MTASDRRTVAQGAWAMRRAGFPRDVVREFIACAVVHLCGDVPYADAAGMGVVGLVAQFAGEGPEVERRPTW